MIAERLALDGGTPYRATWLPFHKPCIEEDEIAEVVDTLRAGWLTTGPRAKRFEREFAAYVGRAARRGRQLGDCRDAPGARSDRHQAGRRGDRPGLHLHRHGRSGDVLRGDAVLVDVEPTP